MDEPFDDEPPDINPIKLNTRIDDNSLHGQTATIHTWQNVTQTKFFDPTYDESDRHFAYQPGASPTKYIDIYKFQQSTMRIRPAFSKFHNNEQLLRLSSDKGNELMAHGGDSGGKRFVYY